ncbi:MAG TPA: hypothetical protein P5572_12850 [Phycisphaerae bacterium]|nr:hypothetical protein [Phycisphaerales bacterium]HRX85899.1 hypothetical protein [Phycisphaerae bacterium]
MNLACWSRAVCACAAAALLTAGQVRADGTETLGLPSVDIATGAGFVAAGTGLVNQPGVIEFDVPADEPVQQVLLYWSGEYRDADDDTVTVNGVEVTGTLIGGSTYFYSYQGDVYVTAYRADITALGLVAAGANSLEVSGLDYDADNAGAGVIAIYGDCGDSTTSQCPYRGKRWHHCSRHCNRYARTTTTADDCADIQVLDGADIAFFQFPEPRQTTVPQTFTFAAASADRVADLALFTGSVEADRPNEIHITVDGETTEIIDLLGDSAGPSWDAPTIPVDIPAGATSLTVEVVSTQSSDPLGASVVWVTAALAVPDASADVHDHKCRRTRHHKSNWCGRQRSGRGWCRHRR